MKQCNKCLQWKDESEFRVRRDNGKIRNECTDCKNAKNREHYWANKERYDAYHAEWRKKNAEYRRKWNRAWDKAHPEARRAIKHRYYYGISRQDYQALFDAQGGVCATCGCPPGEKSLYVDHIHVDGYKDMPAEEKKKYVRGLLCQNCNMAIGLIGEKTLTLRSMASYLERFS